MPYIDVIQPGQAGGRLKEIYEDLAKSRGKIAEIHKIQSLNPETIVRHMDLYMAIMYGKSPLKRVLREMMGVVVSRANKCEYCVRHHAAAVAHYWKDDDRTQQLMKDYTKAGLEETEMVFCELAWHMTLRPGEKTSLGWIEKLKEKGVTDRAILDAMLVISYFNFVNRMVLGLGVELEDDPGGYRYQ